MASYAALRSGTVMGELKKYFKYWGLSPCLLFPTTPWCFFYVNSLGQLSPTCGLNCQKGNNLNPWAYRKIFTWHQKVNIGVTPWQRHFKDRASLVVVPHLGSLSNSPPKGQRTDTNENLSVWAGPCGSKQSLSSTGPKHPGGRHLSAVIRNAGSAVV